MTHLMDSPSVPLNDVDYFHILEINFFTVYATDVAQTTTVSSSEIITIENPALPLKVSCPIVAEPNIPYSCGFASTPGSESLTVKYEESGIENSTTFDPNLINSGI